jgi:hypothetical protein
VHALFHLAQVQQWNFEATMFSPWQVASNKDKKRV